MPAIERIGDQQDPALFCHPQVVREHTARLAAMEQGQRELLEAVRGMVGKIDRQTEALERLAARFSLGDDGVKLRQTGEHPAAPDPKAQR